MKKLKEFTNQELLDNYHYWREQDDDITYSDTHYSNEYIISVEKRLAEVEREALRRMGGFKNE